MDGCTVTDLTVHGQRNCFQFGPEQMEALQRTGVSVGLESGTNIVKIRSGSFGYGASTQHNEPVLLLWIYGGRVINQKTNVPVNATWVSLNGYDDALVMEVLEPATLCAFFFDTYLEDNNEELTLSIVRI
ncbi:hypothetical protein PGN35_021455 [Nodosilinea sp. PGN35]|uniref:hypothetical protein n=1 Tax=Nodosilinea sp. PGN35 TaxID=3020489 RepID=UPI0023B2112D|nr:hypothetical protein [Nodosilinea sp. TSF1-S3]MDF0366926.1 hypothetical protein [Nodosilinea sp. TSF1-S3]